MIILKLLTQFLLLPQLSNQRIHDTLSLKSKYLEDSLKVFTVVTHLLVWVSISFFHKAGLLTIHSTPNLEDQEIDFSLPLTQSSLGELQCVLETGYI